MTISRSEEGEQAAEAFAAIFERDVVDFNWLVEESRPPFCNPANHFVLLNSIFNSFDSSPENDPLLEIIT